MAMNPKLVLAEGLDELKKAEGMERAADALQQRMTKDHKLRDFPELKKAYATAYNKFIRGMELLNAVRQNSIALKDASLTHFCADKMKAYMDRCEKLKEKESNILVSVREAGDFSRDGFLPGEVLFSRESNEPLKSKEAVEYTANLDDGSYNVTVKNYDTYGVASPLALVQVQVTPQRGNPQKYGKYVPSLSAWSRNVGVTGSAKLQLKVTSDSWLRKMHLEVVVRRLIPTEETTEATAWITELPSIPQTAPAAAVPAPAPAPMPPNGMGSPTTDESMDSLEMLSQLRVPHVNNMAGPGWGGEMPNPAAGPPEPLGGHAPPPMQPAPAPYPPQQQDACMPPPPMPEPLGGAAPVESPPPAADGAPSAPPFDDRGRQCDVDGVEGPAEGQAEEGEEGEESVEESYFDDVIKVPKGNLPTPPQPVAPPAAAAAAPIDPRPVCVPGLQPEPPLHSLEAMRGILQAANKTTAFWPDNGASATVPDEHKAFVDAVVALPDPTELVPEFELGEEDLGALDLADLGTEGEGY